MREDKAAPVGTLLTFNITMSQLVATPFTDDMAQVVPPVQVNACGGCEGLGNWREGRL